MAVITVLLASVNITCQSPSILLAKPGQNVIEEMMKIFIKIVTGRNGRAPIQFDPHVIKVGSLWVVPSVVLALRVTGHCLVSFVLISEVR